MDETLLRAAAWAVGILIAHAVISRGIFRLGEASRYRALGCAERLIADDSISESEKKHIVRSLDGLYSSYSAWDLLFALLRVAFSGNLLFRRDELQRDKDVPEDLQPSFDRFLSSWIFGTITNSAVASVLFLAVYILLMALNLSTYFVSSALFEKSDHRNEGGHGQAHA